MEYGRLIRDAWAITWHYRFLWFFGLLAGSGSAMLGSSGMHSNSSSGPPQQFRPAMDAAWPGIEAWATANIIPLIALGGLLIAAIVGLIVASFIARGGMAQATSDLATGRSASFASAWRAVVRYFWRYVGLMLVLIGAGLLVLAAFGMVVAAGFLPATLTGSAAEGIGLGVVVAAAAVATFVTFVLDLTRTNTTPRWRVAVGATLFALPIIPLLVVVALALSIVVVFAERAIAVENLGPLDALKYGWRLMRTHLAESVMTWLINAGLALVSGIVSAAALIGCVAALAAVGALLFTTGGLSAPLFAYLGVGGVLLVAGALIVTAITNTFFWSYWTLVYLRLSGRSLAAEPVA